MIALGEPRRVGGVTGAIGTGRYIELVNSKIGIYDLSLNLLKQDTLDNLFARLEASFDAQRQFAANASHELRTPLTRERTLLQVTLADPDSTASAWQAIGRELLASNAEQERLIGAWTQFAKGGNPNGAGPNFWPAYSGADPQILETNIPPRVITVAAFRAAHHCEFWEQQNIPAGH